MPRALRVGKEKHVSLVGHEMKMDVIMDFVKTFQSKRHSVLLQDEDFLKAASANDFCLLSKSIQLWLKKRASLIVEAMKQTERFLAPSIAATPTLFQPSNGLFQMLEDSEILHVIHSLQKDPTHKDVVQAIFQLTLWSGLRPANEILFYDAMAFLQGHQRKKKVSSPKIFQWIVCFFHWSSYMTRLIYHVKLPSLQDFDPCLQIFFVEGCMMSTALFFRDMTVEPENTLRFTFPSTTVVVNKNLIFDNVLSFCTASFISMTHSIVHNCQSNAKSPMKHRDKTRVFDTWNTAQSTAQMAIKVICQSTMDALTNYIREVVDNAQSHHSLSTFVHFMRADDAKFDQDRYLLMTQQHGIGADDESVGELDYNSNMEEEEDLYPTNPFVDDEAGVKDTESEASEDDYFDTLDDDEDGSDDRSISAPVTVPKKKDKNRYSPAVRNSPSFKMVKDHLGQLRNLMLEFINFSLLETNKEFIDEEKGTTGNRGFFMSYRKECKAFYNAYGVNSHINATLNHKLFLPLWVHHNCKHHDMPGESVRTNTIFTKILSKPTSFDPSSNKNEIKLVIEELLEACRKLDHSYITKCVNSLGNHFIKKDDMLTSHLKENLSFTDVGLMVINPSKSSKQRGQSLTTHHEGKQMQHEQRRRSPRKTKYSGRISLEKAVCSGDDVFVNRERSQFPNTKTRVSLHTKPYLMAAEKMALAQMETLSTVTKKKYVPHSQATRPQKRTKK